ncbi:hypothetical protein BGZ47_007243 [Haplosporangium gracile]|nr:hypothetical protein BGZ47_007243 [Haplosporangium gracile]
MQYTLKPWNEPPENPSLPETIKKSAAAIKTEISEDNRFGRKEMMNTFDVRATVENDLIIKSIIECIRNVAQVACDSKRQCQMLIGLYLEDVFYPSPTPGVHRPAVPVANISR